MTKQTVQEPKIKKNRKKVNWTKAQLLGFWSLVIIAATFWAGVWFGQQSMIQSQAKEAEIKTQAIEAYKAELSKENQ